MVNTEFSLLPGSSPSPLTTIADTGTTGHFLPTQRFFQWALVNPNSTTNIRPTTSPIDVTMPDGDTITSTHEAELPIPMLPPKARLAHLFPSLQHCLLSIPLLCDAGCSATFTQSHVTITYNDTVILSGPKNTTTGLWEIHLSSSPPATDHTANSHSINALFPKTVSDTVAFYHAVLGSPVHSTLLQALKHNFLIGIPGLTESSYKKHMPSSTATAKGHMDQSRKNQLSTKPTTLDESAFPHSPSTHQKTNDVYTTVIPITGKVYSDQTGKFPVTSSKGNAYLFVLYDFDSNYIAAEPIKNRTATSILEACQLCHERLTRAGLKPTFQILDNECSAALKNYFSRNKISYQLVPPGVHRRNAAERAIRSFKNHFLSILSGTDPNFPLKLWDLLIPQAVITLNLLRASRINPQLSAYAQIHGQFCFHKTPMGIPGCKVIIHEKPHNRGTWSPHGTEGFYVGPTLEHYWCFQVWCTATKAIRIVDTLSWFPIKVPLPTPSSLEKLHVAIHEILQELKHPSTDSVIPLSATDQQTLSTLMQTLHQASQPCPNHKPIEESTISELPVLSKTSTDSDLFKEPRNTKQIPSILKNNKVKNKMPPASKVTFHPNVIVPPKKTAHSHTLYPPQDQSPPPISPDADAALRVPLSSTSPVIPAEPLRVPNHAAPSQTDPTPIDPTPAASTTPDANIPTIPAVISPDPDEIPTPPTLGNDDMHPFIKILAHRRSRRKGKGSQYEVLVQWTHHKPTWVLLHIFTSHGVNMDASETVASYAQEQGLLNTKGWKLYRKHLPSQSPPKFSSSSQTPSNKPSSTTYRRSPRLTTKQRLFFKQSQFAMKAVHPDTGTLSEYPALIKSSDGELWEEACCEEIGRLAQGYGPNITGTDTLHFIRFDQIPKGCTATYLRLVVADRPNKENPRRVRFTAGGDRIKYPGDVSTKTSDLSTAKILLNSVISTPGARFMGLDIKDFYLNTHMERYEYMRIPIQCIPQKIFEQYNLEDLVHNGAVYAELQKTIYGLPQAGRIANDKLCKILEAHEFEQAPFTPGLFRHKTRPLAFALVVDDFGCKYVGKENAQFLITTLENAGYKITIDWEGKQFCGIDLHWDYENGTVDLSMDGYVEKALQRFNHPRPTRPQHSPHKWTKPTYGASQQLTAPPDTTDPLDAHGVKRLQEVIGTLLYYARALDSTMLVTLGTLAAAQTKGTQATAEACVQLLDYAATHPSAIIRYHASDMILRIHSDASYLSEPQARSRAGGYFYLGSQTEDHSPLDHTTKANGAIHVLSSIMNVVCASATEAEVGALFYNAQDGCTLRNALNFLGHEQPATPIQTDNACAEGIVNDTVKQKRSKAIDMRFYWIRDRVRQGQFEIFWKKGKDNLGDYFTKHHPTAHHRQMRTIYLHETMNCLIDTRLLRPS